jgi:hypothetical protein
VGYQVSQSVRFWTKADSSSRLWQWSWMINSLKTKGGLGMES